ncbi:hypothetical protein NGM44_05840 [Moraxella sp. FZFQ2102]|uniref:hypothetical protein n=1 Tax=Moraxella sp. FZFQ2102 TaxID=2953752 RepID=UPI00209C1FC8|nr:hypothetical protein [Moraxella sp. FZFQ2102]USZ13929.1 hypothetical protein NGM44_05840 [Moraxella sp. FZFQ2102]
MNFECKITTALIWLGGGGMMTTVDMESLMLFILLLGMAIIACILVPVIAIPLVILGVVIYGFTKGFLSHC